MKKIMGLILAAAMTASMTACSSPAPKETEAPAGRVGAAAGRGAAPAAGVPARRDAWEPEEAVFAEEALLP